MPPVHRPRPSEKASLAMLRVLGRHMAGERDEGSIAAGTKPSPRAPGCTGRLLPFRIALALSLRCVFSLPRGFRDLRVELLAQPLDLRFRVPLAVTHRAPELLAILTPSSKDGCRHGE